MTGKTTIRDVAAKAGVSIATVSKFINATQRFTGAVERRIQSAIDELQYHSSPAARSMITGKTGAVGLAILDICNPHFTNIVKGANRVALARGYTLLLVDTEESQGREEELLGALSRRVDGMIVSTRMPEEQLGRLASFGKPVVLSGRCAPSGIPSISVDTHAAAYMIGELLIKQGHRRIAYLGFPPARPNTERLNALSECLAAHDLSLQRHELRAPTLAEGERVCSTVVLRKDKPDAVVCYNDMVAIGFMGAAKALGVAIPDEMSVVGIDNIPFGRYSSPALTTVDTQSERLGEDAMRLLFQRIDSAEAMVAGHVFLTPQLVLRDSATRRVRVAVSRTARKAR